LGITAPPSPFKASKQSLTVKIALRGIFRRASATIRIILCLTLLFLLLTVTIAGGVIAKQTTESWVEKAVGRNLLLIAHHEICSQYEILLSKFHENRETSALNYAIEEYLIPEVLEAHLNSLSYNIRLERRLVVWAHIKELQGTVIDEHGAYITVGDSREGESLVVGVEPENTFGEWFLDGEFLREEEGENMRAVIGDSIANSMFTVPLEQYLQVYGGQFDVVGVCVDPINNGKVVYVNIRDLQRITGVSKPNILLVKVASLSDYEKVLNEIRGAVKAVNQDFEVLELNTILEKSLAFLGLQWSAIMFLPFCALASAVPCFIGYVVLALTEQRQEFGVLRALGAKPRTILKVVAVQNLVVLFSSYACGVAFGIIITLLILVPNPLVTSFTVLQIAGLLSTALAATFLVSLYPAIKLNRKSILEMLA
jgi:ABC-type lipoprotein release transport system permease subunit